MSQDFFVEDNKLSHNDSPLYITNSIPKKTLVITIACLLSACQTVPKKQNTPLVISPNVNIDKPYSIVDETTLSTKAKPTIASFKWQDFYTDEKLKKLIALGLENNKDLRTALLTIEEAKTRYDISEKAIIPTLASRATMTRQAAHKIDKNPSQKYRIGLSMPSYEVDLWGRVSGLKKEALNQYLATKAGADAAKISIISTIAELYVANSYALAQYEMALATVKSRTHSLSITQKRYEAGLDSKSPSLHASSSLESAKIAMYDAQTHLLKLKNALEAVVGTSMTQSLRPPPRLQKISNQTSFNAGIPSDLLYYRPDILQAEYTLKASGANISAARAAYYPQITLTGNAGFEDIRFSDLISSKKLAWSLAPSMSLPLFDGGRRDANYNLSKIKQQKALATYEKSIETAFHEVSDVLADRVILRKKINSQYKLQSNFDEAHLIAMARFKSGLSSYLPVLEAERSLFMSQQAILQLEQQDLVNQVKLYEALGGGLGESVDTTTIDMQEAQSQVTHYDEETQSLQTTKKIIETEKVTKKLNDRELNEFFNKIKRIASKTKDTLTNVKNDTKKPNINKMEGATTHDNGAINNSDSSMVSSLTYNTAESSNDKNDTSSRDSLTKTQQAYEPQRNTTQEVVVPQKNTTQNKETTVPVINEPDIKNETPKVQDTEVDSTISSNSTIESTEINNELQTEIEHVSNNLTTTDTIIDSTDTEK